MKKLILASASPRRVSLLKQIGFTADSVSPANIDETVLKNEIPTRYVARIAMQKAVSIKAKHKNDFVLAADTTVACGRRILSKAENNEQVKECLKLLSGRKHTVLTYVVVLGPNDKKSEKLVTTKVTFKNLTNSEINAYIESGEGIGKAGGYAIQGLAGAFVKQINGSYTAVVGLPLCEVKNLLIGMGYEK